MKIKKILLLVCAVAMLALCSLGASAASIEHDVSEDNVILTDTCGDSCPGHLITGISHFANNIQILSGEHKVTLKDLDVLCAYPDVAFTVEAGAKADVTVEGRVSFNGEIGIKSHGELNIYGDEASQLYVTGCYEGIYVTDDLTVKGGIIYFGTASFPGEGADPARHHLFSLLAEGDGVTVVFEDADVGAVNNNYNIERPYFAENTGYDHIAACGIKAPKLVVKNTVLEVDTGEVFYEEGLTPKAIGIDVADLSVNGSEVKVEAGNCYNSYGIRCTGNASFVNSEVTVTSGEAQNESIGFGAIGAMPVSVVGSDMDLRSGTSGNISFGGYVNMMDVTDSTVYAYGGEAKHHSAGLVGGLLGASGSDVKGYGGAATEVTEPEAGEEGACSEGLVFETIRGTDSEICGEGEKATVSNGISATDIFIDGGVIYGIGSDEGEDSFGIHLEASQMDDGTAIPGKFEVVGGDIVARGETQGLICDDEAFAGVSYKADESGEAQVKTALDSKEFLFGNQYKVSYIGGDVDAENLPADGAYYRDEWYTLPKEAPTAEGYLFAGWMDAYGTFFDAEDDNHVSMSGADMVYIAVWKCLGGKNCILRDFDDLDAKAWYHDGIEYCLESKMMQGTGKTTFEPDTAATRGMIVTTLYRMEGEPKVETQNEFTDVPAGTWYTAAVNWAVEYGIVKGYEDGTFRPDQPITREELAVFLCRMAEYYGLDVTAPELPKQFADKDDVSKWAVPALEWAVDRKIINGLSKETLVPQGNASRAQLATMLYRFLRSLVGEA